MVPALGDPDLSSRGGRPAFERPRGLVALPAVGTPAAPQERRPFLRRWAVLIATLAVGIVVLVLIALLWSHGQSAPNPRSLPPA